MYYIVNRISRSGGTQYLVEATNSRYRWAKRSKINARLFNNKSAASRVANTFDGNVSEFY